MYKVEVPTRLYIRNSSPGVVRKIGTGLCKILYVNFRELLF
jgi:hypothetical protein